MAKQRTMKTKLGLLFGLVVIVVLLSYMLMFQVGPSEVAVRSTFGKADAADVITDAGLKFRLPWPFQQVHRYTTRTQMIELGDYTVTTKDGYAVTVRSYLAWKVKQDEALNFYRSLRDVGSARRNLADILRSNQRIGEYDFSQLVNTDAGEVMLNQIEQETLTRVQEVLDAQGYGVEAVHVGIRRLVLEPEVTAKVAERMKSNRERLAAKVRSEGANQAKRIVSDAEAKSRTIMSFANNIANEIRTKGRAQAAEYYEVFQQDPQFAILLSQIESLEKTMTTGGPAMLIIDASKMVPFNLFVTPLGNAPAVSETKTNGQNQEPGIKNPVSAAGENGSAGAKP